MENVIKHDASRSHMIRLFSGGDIRVNARQPFASSINSKHKDIQFTSIQNREKQEILTLEKLAPEIRIGSALI